MATLTLTEDQIVALEFFQENEQQVQYFGLMNVLSDREDRLVFKQGRQLAAKVEKIKDFKFTPYTYDQRFLISSLYVEGMTRDEIVAEFVKTFGTDHNEASIGQKVEMIKSADKHNPNHLKFQFRDQELLSILQDLDSDRFVV